MPAWANVVSPRLIPLGIRTRAAALAVAVNMTVALPLLHAGQFFTMLHAGGWTPGLLGFYPASAIAVALLGGGRQGLGGNTSR